MATAYPLIDKGCITIAGIRRNDDNKVKKGFHALFSPPALRPDRLLPDWATIVIAAVENQPSKPNGDQSENKALKFQEHDVDHLQS